MKKLLLTLTLLLTLGLTAAAETVDLSFSNIDPNEDWGSTYAAHKYDTADYTVDFSNHNRQTATITDVPVSKAADVTITLKNDMTFQTVKFTFKQWNTKAQTIKLTYSTNGTDFKEFTPAISSSNFAIEATSIPEGAIAMRATTTKSNQIGVVSIDYTAVAGVADTREKVTLTWSESEAVAKLGEEFAAPTLTAAPEAALAEVAYTSSDESVATIANGVVNILAAGTTTIKAEIANSENYKDAQADYTLTVVDPNAMYEVLTYDVFGYKDNTTTYDTKTVTTTLGMGYKVNAASGKSSIQLRSDTKDNTTFSGIIMIANEKGYVLDRIEVDWNADTSNKRQIDIYGSAQPYSDIKDLYDAATQGDKLTSIAKGTSSATVDGEYAYIGIRSNDGALYLSSITLYWKKASSVAKPEITAEVEDGYAKISITAEEGAKIYYTTDGTEPTTESYLYTAPLEWNMPCTVKAIAVNEAGDVSAVASYKVDMTLVIEDLGMLADAYMMIGGDFKFKFNAPVTVIYKNGNYAYIMSGSGWNASYALVFGYNMPDYVNGDTFDGISGTYTIYKDYLPEIKDATFIGEKQQGNEVQPQMATASDVQLYMLFHYIKIENATITAGSDDKTFTLTDADGNEATLYNQFGVTVPTDGKYNVTGIVSVHGENAQLLPIAFEVPSSEFVGVSHNPRIGKTVVNYDYTLHVNNHLEGQHTYTVTLDVEGIGKFTNTEHTLAADEAEAEPAMLREAAFNATHRLNGSIKVTGLTGETNYKASMLVEMPNGEIHEEPVADFATGTVGITDVAVDEAEAAEYFNLQGVRVAQPEAGSLYIVRRGGKATKELVK